ncbi:MAG TPA: hypothetical protein VGC87_10215 [Pyrinomonadaceae bacterium]|jgi:hypothetical protein
MGGHAWFYFVDYEADINSALQKLREREFRAGRYNPVTWFPEFPVGPDSPAPGAQHASIDEALEEADADGTRSILDMMRIADEPDYFAAAPLPPEDLRELFGTDKPTRELVEANDKLFDALERGQGVYVVVYKDGQPSEIFFAGYSFD